VQRHQASLIERGSASLRESYKGGRVVHWTVSRKNQLAIYLYGLNETTNRFVPENAP
jgi:hypothetical protein